MRVRANSLYVFSPEGYDRFWTHSTATAGQAVRVCALNGAPPPNTMGHCHIEDATTKEFLGMVDTRSLSKAGIAVTRGDD